MNAHPVLALNTTRKTLLASRVKIVSEHGSPVAVPSVPVMLGDAIWIESCHEVDTTGMPSALDLLFLDGEHRVVEIARHLPPGVRSPKVDHAVGVLELPAGTIPITHTELGDEIEIEAVLAGSAVSDEKVCRRES